MGVGGGGLSFFVLVSPLFHKHFEGSAPRLYAVDTVTSVYVAPSLPLKGGQFGPSEGRVLGSAD